ncbi:unnamed protein product [Phaeothamnion confervicola]
MGRPRSRCAECRRHFLTMYDNCDNGRCSITARDADSRNAALWLWRAHNNVNARLAAAAAAEAAAAGTGNAAVRAAGGAAGAAAAVTGGAADPHRYAWPRQSHCPGCWLGVTDYGRPIWDEEEVYKHLKKSYSCSTAADAAAAGSAGRSRWGRSRRNGRYGGRNAGGGNVGEDSGSGGGGGGGGRGLSRMKILVGAMMLVGGVMLVATRRLRGRQARRVGREKKTADYSHFSADRVPLPSPYIYPTAVTSPDASRSRFFPVGAGGAAGAAAAGAPAPLWDTGHRRRNSSPGINGRHKGGGGGGTSGGSNGGCGGGGGDGGGGSEGPAAAWVRGGHAVSLGRIEDEDYSGSEAGAQNGYVHSKSASRQSSAHALDLGFAGSSAGAGGNGNVSEPLRRGGRGSPPVPL